MQVITTSGLTLDFILMKEEGNCFGSATEEPI
jgi:hypothetical protein